MYENIHKINPNETNKKKRGILENINKYNNLNIMPVFRNYIYTYIRKYNKNIEHTLLFIIFYRTNKMHNNKLNC